MSLWSRRKFFLTSLAGTAAAGTSNLLGAPKTAADFPIAQTSGAGTKGTRPVMISSANGVHALQKGMDILKNGGDTLDAAVAAVTVVEDDPHDDSVGYGGLPNEEGEVELDASVMHGPTRRAGSVASRCCTSSPAAAGCLPSRWRQPAASPPIRPTRSPMTRL